MNLGEMERVVRTAVAMQLAAMGSWVVPAAVSNRHIHLSEADKNSLFGVGYQLTPAKALSQPGQFACKETVTFAGAKGTLEKIRVLGPERLETQLELALTDCYKAGVLPMVKNSGDIGGTPGGTLTGPMGRVEIATGVIVSARHLHISAEQAVVYGLTDGAYVTLQSSGLRGVSLHNVLVRAGAGHELELHLDTDEANACTLCNGDLLELLATSVEGNAVATLLQTQATLVQTQATVPLPLVTEREVLQASRSGVQTLYCAARGIITPLAKDAAKDKTVKIIRIGEKNGC